MREQSGAINPKHQSPSTKFFFFLGKLLAQIAFSSKSTLVSFPSFTTKQSKALVNVIEIRIWRHFKSLVMRATNPRRANGVCLFMYMGMRL